MKIREFIDIVQKFTYKPNWELQLNEDERKMCWTIRVTAMVQDSREWLKGKHIKDYSIVPIISEISLDYNRIYRMPKEELAYIIKDHLKMREFHELEEWLRYDNCMAHDPHSKDRYNYETQRNS